MLKAMPDWDQRFAEADFAYGTAPNDFLTEMAGKLPPGPVLSLAEGQGRNAVYLASLGFEVTAVDQSAVGLNRARALATERGVRITTQQADLAHFTIPPNAWAGIISIFCHLPVNIRKPLHAAVANGLQPGGVFLLEAYHPNQAGRGTGGPPTPDLMMTLANLRDELPGLEFVVAREIERDVIEGAYHNGRACVTQLLARRPE